MIACVSDRVRRPNMIYSMIIDFIKHQRVYIEAILSFQIDRSFLSSLQLLLQKARHRDSDPAAAEATAAALAHFLRAYDTVTGKVMTLLT